MRDAVKYSYGKIQVSREILDMWKWMNDPRPLYGPPTPFVAHVCNCSYCDIEEEY